MAVLEIQLLSYKVLCNVYLDVVYAQSISYKFQFCTYWLLSQFHFCAVAEGLRYLREQKVVHRDIKPGNIMKLVTAEGRWVNNVHIIIKSTT